MPTARLPATTSKKEHMYPILRDKAKAF
uniref:Uncharacterized protein n=1 Tax=Ralstonia solanacearum CFBP2957 TaxID=859656 RepID=D8P6W4_RALSL|nr:protein of unknown function [Ralstonia solanacearum CFBP2957]